MLSVEIAKIIKQYTRYWKDVHKNSAKKSDIKFINTWVRND